MKFLLPGEETSRLKFDLVNSSDYKYWLPFFQNPETSIHWIESRESAEEACQKWYERQHFRYENNLGGMNSLIEKKSGELIGYCGLLVQTVDGLQELEVGYSLLPKFWNQGYASEAAKKCRDYAFQSQYAESLISIISVTNLPSKNVALKNGMTNSKTTIYKGNNVDIFRIDISHWRQLIRISKES